MLKLVKLNLKNVWDIVKLHVSEDQDDYVASNRYSIVEAYVTITNNGYAFPFGLYDDETPIGFLMIGYDVDDYWDSPPQIAKGNYSIWRLMIDEKHQNKGYGKQAMKLALDFIRSFPCGKAEYCYLSYEPENVVAKNLYASFGFIENGEMDEDEVVAILKL